MVTVTFIDVHDAPDTDRHPRALVTGVLLSVALHVGIAAWLTYAPSAEPEKPPPQFIVDVVQIPKPPPPEPPPPPRPAPAPPQALPPPPPPQLTEAPIAEKSVAPPHPSHPAPVAREKTGEPKSERKTEVAHATPLPITPNALQSTPVSHGVHDATPETTGSKPTEVASQTVQDFILMQIARVWIIDLRSPRFHGLQISWAFVLRPDGTLAPPFGKDDPWDVQRMVNPETYATMQEQTEQGQIFRTAVTTFLQAIRQAQPFRVPPNERSYKDRVLPLHFRAADLPQSPSQAGR